MAWRKRIDSLRALLEASPPAPAARTGLPSEVIALAEKGWSLAGLTQSYRQAEPTGRDVAEA
jgi:hypothetical protein